MRWDQAKLEVVAFVPGWCWLAARLGARDIRKNSYCACLMGSSRLEVRCCEDKITGSTKTAMCR